MSAAPDEASPSPRRRFTIADGMILTAAAAVGFVLIPPLFYVREADHLGAVGFIAALGAAALLLCRWMGPRTILRSDYPPPGDATCFAIYFGLVVNVLTWVPGEVALHGVGLELLREYAGIAMGRYSPATAVLVAWRLMPVIRAWRPAYDWIDAAGIRLGTFCLAWPITWCLYHQILSW